MSSGVTASTFLRMVSSEMYDSEIELALPRRIIRPDMFSRPSIMVPLICDFVRSSSAAETGVSFSLSSSWWTSSMALEMFFWSVPRYVPKTPVSLSRLTNE